MVEAVRYIPEKYDITQLALEVNLLNDHVYNQLFRFCLVGILPALLGRLCLFLKRRLRCIIKLSHEIDFLSEGEMIELVGMLLIFLEGFLRQEDLVDLPIN